MKTPRYEYMRTITEIQVALNEFELDIFHRRFAPEDEDRRAILAQIELLNEMLTVHEVEQARNVFQALRIIMKRYNYKQWQPLTLSLWLHNLSAAQTLMGDGVFRPHARNNKNILRMPDAETANDAE